MITRQWKSTLIIVSQCCLKASLLKIQEQLQLLQQQYDDSVAQLEELKKKKELTIIRLERASVLTTSLAEEQVLYKDLPR